MKRFVMVKLNGHDFIVLLFKGVIKIQKISKCTFSFSKVGEGV